MSSRFGPNQWDPFAMAASGSSAPLPASSAPPYPGAARLADSPCFPQYTASLKCLEANADKSKCQQEFDYYKECKKKEREARLERNRKRSFFQ
ncbi:coiled-coil-helix-coiled-coil-helix domain containing 7 [Musa troglodytarum]|uniref:Coiled-coil-helix-coiled-coil-helix domain containing 7 n=1 Tax=Musa troglodytarum TaxID=320322 RepID=A0A9E7J9U6_9LILI|nr:coiled-coil-helix-coiled-coil-helix domain containing 7 [Musa troglodytarum]